VRLVYESTKNLKKRRKDSNMRSTALIFIPVMLCAALILAAPYPCSAQATDRASRQDINQQIELIRQELDQRLPMLRQELEQVITRLTRREDRQGSSDSNFSQRLDNLSSKIDGLEMRLDSLSAKVDALSLRYSR